jgi:hypothetical protein
MKICAVKVGEERIWNTQAHNRFKKYLYFLLLYDPPVRNQKKNKQSVYSKIPVELITNQ